MMYRVDRLDESWMTQGPGHMVGGGGLQWSRGKSGVRLGRVKRKAPLL